MADIFVWGYHHPRTPPPPEVVYHIVQQGDTLSEIAVRYDTTIVELIGLNNISNPDFILVGQTLILPEIGIYDEGQ